MPSFFVSARLQSFTAFTPSTFHPRAEHIPPRFQTSLLLHANKPCLKSKEALFENEGNPHWFLSKIQEVGRPARQHCVKRLIMNHEFLIMNCQHGVEGVKAETIGNQTSPEVKVENWQ